MDYSHPAFLDMLKFGCTNQSKVLLAFRTYIELCEVYVLKEVEYHLNENLNIIYLSSTTKDKIVYYVPVSILDELSPAWIRNVQKEICSDGATSELNIVIRDTDSSSVYYTITPGLVPPPSPETKKMREEIEEQKGYMESEIRKRRGELYRVAKQEVSEL